MTELFDWLTVKFRLNTLFIFSNTNYGLYPGYFVNVSTTIVSLEYNSPDIDCPSFSRPMDPYLSYGDFFLGNLDLSETLIEGTLNCVGISQ